MLKQKNKVLTDRIQNKRQCKRASARVYASNLRAVARLAKKKFDGDLKWLAKDAKPILKVIRKHQVINTVRNYINASIIGLDLLRKTELKKLYIKALSEVNAEKEEQDKGGKMNQNPKNKTSVQENRME